MIEISQLADIPPCAHYAANGVQSAFPFTFPVFEFEDMEVWVDEARQSPSAYTISGIGVAVGGSVLFLVPPPAGTRITLRRRMSIRRDSEFPDTAVEAKPLNDVLCRQVAALQQVAFESGLAVKRSFRSLSDADLTLPEPQAGRAVRWNDAGDGLVNTAVEIDTILPQARAEAQAAAESAAQAQASNTAAGQSRSAAETARAICDADVVVTGADRAATAADRANVAADAAETRSDRLIAQDAAQTAVAAQTAAQAAQTAAAQNEATADAAKASAQTAATTAQTAAAAAHLSELSAAGSAAAAASSAAQAQAAAGVYTFSTIAVAGQSAIAADQAGDTLTLAAGPHMAITTDAAADTVTLAVTGLGAAASYDVGTGSGQIPTNAMISTGQETITAGEALSALDAVYLDDGNLRGGGASKWYRIDTDATAPVRIGRVRGIALAAIAAGSTGPVQTGPGVVSGLSGLTAGRLIYAAAAAGGMTQTEPAAPSSGTQNAVCILGRALSDATMQFEPWHDVVFQARTSGMASGGSTTIEHYIDSGARERVARSYTVATPPSPIPGAVGTAIGDMTSWGGLAASFDGVTSTASAACSYKGDYSGWVGKDWGAGVTRTLTGFTAYGASDNGFANGAASTITLSLEASTDNFSSSIVTLWTGGISNPNTAGIAVSQFSGIAAGSYRYHRVRQTGSNGALFAEVQFHEAGITRSEPLTIGSEVLNSAGTDRVTVKFADSGDANQDTRTTFYNRTGATRDLIFEVAL